MNETSVPELLELLTSDPEPVPEWEDVLRRARVQRPSRRRALVVLVAAGAALVVLFATPAFGLRQAVLDLARIFQ